jgi:hypothetical protein
VAPNENGAATGASAAAPAAGRRSSLPTAARLRQRQRNTLVVQYSAAAYAAQGPLLTTLHGRLDLPGLSSLIENATGRIRPRAAPQPRAVPLAPRSGRSGAAEAKSARPCRNQFLTCYRAAAGKQRYLMAERNQLVDQPRDHALRSVVPQSAARFPRVERSAQLRLCADCGNQSWSSSLGVASPPNVRHTICYDAILEPIQEVRIQEQRVGLVNRRSMMRIIARRINAAADRA